MKINDPYDDDNECNKNAFSMPLFIEYFEFLSKLNTNILPSRNVCRFDLSAYLTWKSSNTHDTESLQRIKGILVVLFTIEMITMNNLNGLVKISCRITPFFFR